MAKNFRFGIAARLIAVTIATAGITTVSSFTLVLEAQASSIKSAAKKSAQGINKPANTVHRTESLQRLHKIRSKRKTSQTRQLRHVVFGF